MITLTKEELLGLLQDKKEIDSEADHREAEDWLLNFVNDPQITEAWKKRQEKQSWAYGEKAANLEDIFGKQPKQKKGKKQLKEEEVKPVE